MKLWQDCEPFTLTSKPASAWRRRSRKWCVNVSRTNLTPGWRKPHRVACQAGDFAQDRCGDLPAVRAALQTEWSNGSTEATSTGWPISAAEWDSLSSVSR